tara:strand:+ start:709 stop:936 length:228 start_codon:yes stop_codon:yes gene_type:complete
MPYHNSMKPKNSDKPPSKQMINLINKSNLHHSRKKAMLKHSNHHSKKHISMMIDLMKKGMNFKESHVATIKKIGK